MMIFSAAAPVAFIYVCYAAALPGYCPLLLVLIFALAPLLHPFPWCRYSDDSDGFASMDESIDGSPKTKTPQKSPAAKPKTPDTKAVRAGDGGSQAVPTTSARKFVPPVLPSSTKDDSDDGSGYGSDSFGSLDESIEGTPCNCRHHRSAALPPHTGT